MGTSETTFSPEKECTRAEAVTFLYRLAGSPEPKATTCAFTDVAESDYFYKAVLWAVENGITNGTTETTFSPDAICERAHIVTFIARYANAVATSVATNFADVDANDYYAGSVAWAEANGITKGTSETTFSPEMACNRAQIVTFLYRYAVK